MANKRYLMLRPLTIANQMLRIQQLYSGIIEAFTVAKSELICVIRLQPSEHSDTYRIKIQYKISDVSPKAWLLSPEMKTYEGKHPHHVYGRDEHGHYQLCVHYYRDKSWNQQMFIAESFILWVCTWLSTYEYWLITGEWYYDEAFSEKSNTRKPIR